MGNNGMMRESIGIVKKFLGIIIVAQQVLMLFNRFVMDNRREFLKKFFASAASVVTGDVERIAKHVAKAAGAEISGIANFKEFKLMLDIFDYHDYPGATVRVNGLSLNVDEGGRAVDKAMMNDYGDRWLCVKLQLRELFSKSRNLDRDVDSFLSEALDGGCYLPSDDSFKAFVVRTAMQTSQEIKDGFVETKSEMNRPIFADMASARKMCIKPSEKYGVKKVAYDPYAMFASSERIDPERMIADRSKGQESYETSR